MMRAVPLGTGSYLPARIVTNADLEKQVETNDAWIRERTGITQRHIAAEGENTSHLAIAAGKQALQRAGVTGDTVDTLILATATPDETFPSTSTRVQHALGMGHATAMDVNAACSGFVYSLKLADALIRSGQSKRILLIGAETMSRVVDWTDRGTCILFGDGAGALVLEAQAESKAEPHGILTTHTASDGSLADILCTDGGVSSTKTAGLLHMAGQEVFRHAVNKMGESLEIALGQAGLTAGDITWLVPHQANARILHACARKFSISEEKLITTVSLHANTSSASIPLALAHLQTAGKLASGDIVAMPALGAGLTWGTCIIRW